MTPLRLVAMRRRTDCGVASLATLLGLPYEDTAEAITLTNGRLGSGLYLTSLIRAAAHLGRTLKKVKTYNPDEAEGILWVDGGTRMQHFVVLADGKVFDPQDATLWDLSDYLSVTRGTAKTLLVLDEAPLTA